MVEAMSYKGAPKYIYSDSIDKFCKNLPVTEIDYLYFHGIDFLEIQQKFPNFPWPSHKDSVALNGEWARYFYANL